jgi:hypothetical protein
VFDQLRLTSPLKLANRRSYEVLDYLAVAAGAPIVIPGDDGIYRPRNDAETAMVCAQVADIALGLAVETAAEGSRRWTRRFYKACNTDNGPAAVLAMAHGLAAISMRMSPAGPSHERQREARRVLTSAFGPTADDDRFLTELVAQIDPEGGDGLMPTRVELAFNVTTWVLGADAASMPGFAKWNDTDGLPGVDEFVSGMAWQICFNHITTEWLRATDPERVIE